MATAHALELTVLLYAVRMQSRRYVVLDSAFQLCVFFFNDRATTEIYPLSLHDALPIPPSSPPSGRRTCRTARRPGRRGAARRGSADRKSTRLNSSHVEISYAVFCLKKKKGTKIKHGTGNGVGGAEI